MKKNYKDLIKEAKLEIHQLNKEIITREDKIELYKQQEKAARDQYANAELIHDEESSQKAMAALNSQGKEKEGERAVIDAANKRIAQLNENINKWEVAIARQEAQELKDITNQQARELCAHLWASKKLIESIIDKSHTATRDYRSTGGHGMLWTNFITLKTAYRIGTVLEGYKDHHSDILEETENEYPV